MLSIARSALRPGEIAVDLFAGGGGWSEGFQRSAGVPPAIAINHDAHSIAMHTANHPESEHYQEDVFHVVPGAATRGRPVGWLHASPDCRHFSRAKGAVPNTARALSKKIRGLAWVIVKWAAAVRPRIISLENVAEFTSWCPLHQQGKNAGTPMKRRKGETFEKFVAALRTLGYVVEWRMLKACDFGAPTSRKRLFILARRDGRPIVWPSPTHAPRNSEAVRAGRLLPYVSASACIDWSIRPKSIFDRKKPLADATLRRIAEGIRKFLLECDDPFLVNLTHGGRLERIDEPLRTVTSAHRGEKAVVAPIVAKTHSNGSDGDAAGVTSAADPTRTLLAKDGLAVVTPVLMANNTNNVPTSLEDPLGTITTGNRHFAIEPQLAPHITKFRENSIGSSIDEPLHTITSGAGSARPAGAAHALEIAAPIIARTAHGETGVNGSKRWGVGAHGAMEPIPTITGSNDYALIAPTLVQTGYGEREGQKPRTLDIHEPLGTAVSGGQKHNLCAALLAKHYGGHVTPGSSLNAPFDTLTTQDHHHLVQASLTKLYGTARAGADATEPVPTITGQGGHLGVVAANLVSHYGESGAASIEDPAPSITAGGMGHTALVEAPMLTAYYGNESSCASVEEPMRTVTVKDRCALVKAFLQRFLPGMHFDGDYVTVQIRGAVYVIVDIAMRMLVPRELARATGFPDDYILCGTQTQQVARIGNAVPPAFAEALVRANLNDDEYEECAA